MADKKITAANLLPEFLRTEKNKKFLASTIDQFIHKPQLERLDGYVGSTQTPTYNSTADIYISNGKPYQLDPALITYDSLGNVLGTQGYDDLINEISAKGGLTNNLDRLFRPKVYSYNAHIDWDKLVNYQNYYWMPTGPEVLEVLTENLDVDYEIVGRATANVTVLVSDGTSTTIPLSNGMLIEFSGINVDDKYYNNYFFVEGVGSSIVLVPYDKLLVSENFLSPYPEGFDSQLFDDLPFDNDRELPTLHAEYVTISRASTDLNPWTRYNRWVHKDVVKTSALLNGTEPNFSVGRAQRPIIEFKPNIKLFNFGSVGVDPVDLFDTEITDAFNTVEGATSPVLVDGIELEEGHRVIFNADEHDDIVGKIFEVRFVTIQGLRTLTLQPTYDHVPPEGATVAVLLGLEQNGNDWWFNGTKWILGQQKTQLNQAPLFDLFDLHGRSYGDKSYYLSDFAGNKIFSYAVGSGSDDTYLGFPLSYRNIEAIGSILFDNNLVTDEIVISQLGSPTYTLLTNVAYCKIEDRYENAWVEAEDYPMPVLTSTATGITSYYEEPLSLTNNPLNGVIKEFTISELTEHVQTMIGRIPGYAGNLRDIADYTKYGIKLISNANPIAFAQMFIGKKEHNLIDAITISADKYNKFKLAFLNGTLSVSQQASPAQAVDEILLAMNQNKLERDPYHFTDMLGYGPADNFKTWTITNSANISYPLTNEFSLAGLSSKSVLVYHTPVNSQTATQLVYGRDYVFNTDTISVEVLITLSVGDTLLVNEFTDTTGSYIPPTPTKLGLYPKTIPTIFVDNTYTTPQTVIQGHDGSIMLAYGDYRDAIILELEKRIYNNIKAVYRPELIDMHSVVPGAFRETEYTRDEVNDIIGGDFVRWAAEYSIDYVSNSFFDPTKSITWNFVDTRNTALNFNLNGSYRGILKWLYDTDRPHTAPWEMLGLLEKPSWWENLYGPAPYTGGNLVLWGDLEAGRINGVVNLLYARPGLLGIIPVDDSGNLVDPTVLVTNYTESGKRQPWKVGDHGPAETAWRRSSYYPFAIQKLLALTKPATYASLMYDVSRIKENASGQIVYGDSEIFLNLKNLYIYNENKSMTSGYSVLVSEIGKQRTNSYIEDLRQDLDYANYNLLYKLNGFADKDTLQIIIDAYEPTSNSPGSILPSQNYQLRLNVSNPIKSVGVSGIVIQKLDGKYVVKGYDKQQSYFTIYKPVRNVGTPSITVGGVSEKYVTWTASGTSATPGLSATDTITANSAAIGHFYQKGQYVQYGNSFYRVTVAHQSGSTFNSSYFQSVPVLPTTGGATVQTAASYEKTETIVPYGTSYSSIQEVYDLIIGYGRWLTAQGFIFNEFNDELNSVVDWTMSGKEFLFWTTQNWSSGSVITVSPFADKLVYQGTNGVVDNIFDSFYEYSILRADGTAFPQSDLNISRVDGICTISTMPNTDGIYFARLNLVQKEHAIIFDNKTIFGDVIYETETGSRQRRVKLVGFRTANWDGDYTSPGFVYDTAVVTDWEKNKVYIAGDVVRFNGKYYSAIKTIERASTFDFTKWDPLNKKPTPGLLPNFDYKISQFEDFYSLDSENFDAGQQKMSQHLTGYTPRVYLNNIFTDPVAQYKFYQGFIKEKGTQNAISKLSKSSLQTLKGDVTYNEEWAFRVGHFGAFTTYQELEVPLIEGTFLENPQIINFVDSEPAASANNLIHYALPGDLTISPDNYVPANTFETNSSEEVLVLEHSGYVRLDDVTATAYNENSLLDIANAGQLKDGDTIWLGFKQDGSWDVYRYTYNAAGVIGVFVSAPLSTITFTTQYSHNLSEGQIIGINQFNDQVNGIYIVKEVNNSKQFTVSSELASIENAPLPAPGQLYVFASARLSNFNLIPTDQELFRLPNGTKFWIDGSETTGWEVYEKINNYSSTAFNSFAIPPAQQSGAAISKRKGDRVVVVGSPGYVRGAVYGTIRLYDTKLSSDALIRFALGGSYQTQPNNGFGSVIVYDNKPFTGSNYGLVFAGAPGVDSNRGIVKISVMLSDTLIEGATDYIVNPSSLVTKFGSTIYVEKDATSKLVLIGGANTVHAYTVSDNNGSIAQSAVGMVCSGFDVNSISGANDASYIAIGSNGFVEVYNKSLNRVTKIVGKESTFGKVVLFSADGSYLFISATSAVTEDYAYGKVYVYKNTNGTFVLDQTLSNPVVGAGMNFGVSMDINETNDTLVVTATGINHTISTLFDSGKTTFDGGITRLLGTELGSGAAYVYNRKDTRFVYAQELTDPYILQHPGNNFGTTVAVDTTSVLVGAPAFDNATINNGFYQFTCLDTTTQSWSKIRSQDTFVDISPVKKITLIDTDKDQVLEYLDIFDPIKGKIPGIAEQELSYKLASDPAIYSIGVAGVNVNTDKNWLDEQVGKLWWDLSTAKYVWYEQGDLEYRKNNWGKLFPGATIDVYEWVSSTLLPSEWATKADTPKGLVDGISGQPKFVDNSVISVKQVYDPVSNSFSNVYYYWVKNKVVVPNKKDRRLSAYAVASAIADPSAYGLSFVAAIDQDAIMLSNIGPMVVGSKISLNISQDYSKKFVPTPKHTQWLLLQEGDAESMPPAQLEKKLVDSLLGHDKLGNLVPDPSLSTRTKYGIGIRPQQTLFNDRLQALRNIVEFSNSVLQSVPVTGNYSFKNLNAQEEIPNKVLNEYDHLVEDNSELGIISTVGFERAVLDCSVNESGSIFAVSIVNSGFGYGTLNPVYDMSGTLVGYQGPTFTEVSYSTLFDHGTTTFDAGLTTFKNGNVNLYGNGLKIETLVNEQGQIISAAVINGGKGFISGFKYLARPQTVVVQSDDTYNGKWTRYEFDYTLGTWVRAHTQSYNTQLYWDYVDWYSNDYNMYQIYSAIIGSPYELNEVSLTEGQYVKVNNGGDGNYIILQKIDDAVRGSYGMGYNIVYKENGTIQISDSVWNLRDSGLGWSYINTYDQSLWDQTPDIELQYILAALKNDLFINELKVNWNLLFFAAVKYAMTEQKVLDWAFKTSFINVVNTAGELNQLPVYKLQDSTFYEKYINEVKPYHTQIRNFTTEYSLLETTDSDVVEVNTATSITIKFDRTTAESETGGFTTKDTFICNGVDTEFILNWIPNPDKLKMNVKLNGLLLLSSNYTVEYYTSPYNGYTKKYAKLVLLDKTPDANSVLTIAYEKSGDILNAADRILGYYTATSGMIGLDLGQLISGIDYPGTQIDGLGFADPRGAVNLDSIIVGGSWNDGHLSSAEGINPADIVIDGQNYFLTPEAGHAPEENVPGFVTDSLGINVFTKGPSGPAVVLSAKFDLDASTSTVSFALLDLPSTLESMSVVCNGVELQYTEDELTVDQPYYNLDWENSLLIVPPQSVSGELGYTIIGVGGGSGTTFGIVSREAYFAGTATNASFESYIDKRFVFDEFVTVNGMAIDPVTTSTDYGYMLTENTVNHKCVINLYNLPAGVNNTVQVWYFNESHTYYNEIREQTFVIDLASTSIPLSLTYPPGNLGPASAHSIVEISDSYGTRRLLPPDVNYYEVTTSTGVTFPVEVTNTFTDSLSTSTISVYKNGVLAPFTYSSGTITVTTSCQAGDEIAIESYLPDVIGIANTLTDYSYDYRIEGSNLFIAPGAQVPDSNMISTATIKVITYTNHDGLFMNTEKFVGDPNRRFEMDRPVIDDRYVWVTLFRRTDTTMPMMSYPLINGYDFTILEDNQTIQISDSWEVTYDDIVEVISFINQAPVVGVIGYRIFNDMLGGTTFTRLSHKYSTYLTKPLLFTDTKIFVKDVDAFTPPDAGRNIPGVVYIHGERIEFFDTENNNALTQLRRGTLGTSPAYRIPAGVRVIDQGARQHIDTMETVCVQNTFTNTLTNVYAISKVDLNRYYPGSTDLVRCDGIVLSTATNTIPVDLTIHNTISTDISAIDQVDVYYGGRLLRKSSFYYHDTTVTYDSISPDSIVGSVANINLLPTTAEVGDSYLIESNNQVWSYTGVRSETTATAGYVYSGLNFHPQEFFVEAVPNQVLILNTATVKLEKDVQITLVKKEYLARDEWNDKYSPYETKSLIDSTSTVAMFLKEAPAELPLPPFNLA